MRRVLLTGAGGFLGSFLAAELQRREIEFMTAGRRGADLEMDLGDVDSLVAVLAASGATELLNAGAYSRTDACAENPSLAMRVNGAAVEALARSGLRLLQVSTDLVFAGSHAPYLHTACPGPLSDYAQSKRAGERYALAAGALVIRLPLLFGRLAGSDRGASGMLRRSLRQDDRLRLFCDEYRTPLHAGDAARSLVDLLGDHDLRGVHHLAGPERLSRWEFGQRFLSVHELETTLWQPTLRGDAQRPKDVSLISDWWATRSLDAALADS